MQLRLAIDIADVITRAAETGYDFDLRAKAEHLRGLHPEAHVTRDEIVEVLASEKASTSQRWIRDAARMDL